MQAFFDMKRCIAAYTDCVRSVEWWGFLDMGMCDFPIGYFPPGQLSRNRGSIDKQHLAKEIQNN